MAIFDVIKYEGPNDVLVWQWPGDELGWGTQVIVNQTQEVLFYKDGQAMDLLGPGRHTLKTANIPVLKNIFSIPFGNESPFKAEIYFIDKVILLDMKWGTQQPMPVLDPILNIFLPIRAHGQFGFRVSDARKLVVQLVGTVPSLKKEDIVNYFRGVILTKTKDHIATKLIEERLSILNVSARLDDFSTALKDRLSEDFAKFGLEVVNFFVNSIDVPEDDPEVQHVKQAMANNAEMKIMGADGYKMKRAFDVLELAAKNEGGGSSQFMGMGMGLGMGMGAGTGMANMTSNLLGGATQSQKALPAASSMIVCPGCGGQTYSAYKFCTHCGEGVAAANGVCPACQSEVPVGGKFCGHCGLKLVASLCAKCSHEMAAAAKHCSNCGEKREPAPKKN